MATRLKLFTDPLTGLSAWYNRSSGEPFIQCAYSPVVETYDFCAPPPSIPEMGEECGVTVTDPPGIGSSNSSRWSDLGDGGGGSSSGGSSFSSRSFSSSFYSSSRSSISSSYLSYGSSSSYSSSVGCCGLPIEIEFASYPIVNGDVGYTIGYAPWRTVSLLSGDMILDGAEDADRWLFFMGTDGDLTFGVSCIDTVSLSLVCGTITPGQNVEAAILLNGGVVGATIFYAADETWLPVVDLTLSPPCGNVIKIILTSSDSGSVVSIDIVDVL